jgi:hypothetical protein
MICKDRYCGKRHPRLYQKSYRRLFVFPLTAGVLIVGVLVHIPTVTPKLLLIVTIGTQLLFVVAMVVFKVKLMALCVHAKAANYLLCEECGYDLQGMVVATTAPLICPECGTTVRADELMKMWKSICH